MIRVFKCFINFFPIFPTSARLHSILFALASFWKFSLVFFRFDYHKQVGHSFRFFNCFPLNINRYQKKRIFNPFEWDMDEIEKWGVCFRKDDGTDEECLSIMLFWLLKNQFLGYYANPFSLCFKKLSESLRQSFWCVQFFPQLFYFLSIYE